MRKKIINYILNVLSYLEYLYKSDRVILVLLFLFVAFMFIDIFLIVGVYTILHFVLFSLWVLLVAKLNFTEQISLSVALLLLLLIPFFVLFGMRIIAEKCAIWTLFMLWVGGIQMFLWAKKNDKKKV